MPLRSPTGDHSTLTIQDWPEIDRSLWLAACAPPKGLLDEEGGRRSGHRPLSNKKVQGSYARWLGFLRNEGLLDPNVHPVARITLDRVKAFVAFLQLQGNGTYTILSRLQDLGNYACAVDPTFDRSPLSRLHARVRAFGPPPKDKRRRLVASDELHGLGLALMQSAEALPSPRIAALAFRDGLMIAFLAVRPLRLHNLAGLALGTTLRRSGEVWSITIPDLETKNHSAIEDRWPKSLEGALDVYLAVHRPLLAALPNRWSQPSGNALWLASGGSPLSEGRINTVVCRRTRDAFGKKVNPHLFRDSAATTLAIEDPQHVRAASTILGHRSAATTEAHYQLATALQAHRNYMSVLAPLWDASTSPRGAGKNTGKARRTSKAQP